MKRQLSRSRFGTVFTMLLVGGLTLGNAGPMPAGDKKGEKASNAKEGNLGLMIERVPPAFHSHMPALPKGQGVLVDQVAKDSPAARAGLRAHDILLSYDDQKLYSPEQFVKLVRSDRPGHEAAIGFLRGGKMMSCKAILGEAALHPTPKHPPVHRFIPDETSRQIFESFQSKMDDHVWNLFDSVKLTRLDNNRWRAEVEYRSTTGKKDSKTYTGTRDEIRKAIEKEKDLPEEERCNLLQVLSLQGPIFEFRFPPLDMLGPDSNP